MFLRRSYIIAAFDIIVATFSFVFALYLRLGENFIQATDAYIYQNTIIFTLIATFVFFTLKTYRGVWRYASLQDLISIVRASSVIITIFYPCLFFINRLETIPRSVPIINWMVLIILLGGARFSYRMLREKRFSLNIFKKDNGMKIPVILAGMNNNAELFIRETLRSKNSIYHIVGIIDNDTTKIGSHIYGIKIHGSFNNLENVINNLKNQKLLPQKIILTSEYLDGQVVRDLMAMAEKLGLTLNRLPNITDFKTASIEAIEARPIAIEDLLGRAQNTLDRDAMQSLIAGKRILITGCGGTIGSELTRQIARYNPASITLLDLSEYQLYQIDKELSDNHVEIAKQAYLADVKNSAAIDHIFATHKPELVFHAAAIKHVPIAEANVCETILTNVIGTKNVADACLKHQVQKMVLISTDKAVHPTNVMGATKRIAESYIQSIGEHLTGSGTDFITVRFGNVLGSSGSVIPLFEKQLKSGGPLTVTHPEMTRYFMTVREAVELVLLASSITISGHSAIYVLDMGEPVSIKDLAIQMIKLAGLRPEEDIKIAYTGIRPGEKLYEELFYQDEAPIKTSYDGILIAKSKKVDFAIIEKDIKEIEKECSQYDQKKALAILQNLAPEYQSK